MLDIRLQTCFDMVSGRGTVCDVGTDHAYLAAELVISGKCSRVIASDVKEGPLASAAKTVERYGISDKVQLVLSDGLAEVPLDGVTDIIIAGMGGETMVHILADCPFSLAERRLILQPMSKAEILQEWLLRSGFAIREEVCVPDGKFLYAVLYAEYTGIPAVPAPAEIWFGAMDLHEENARAYAVRQQNRLERRLSSIREAGQEDAALAEAVEALNRRLEETA